MAETKTIMGVALVVVALVFFAAGYFSRPVITPPERETGETWNDVLESGTITVATSPDWPPFEYGDPDTNKITGFEVDVLEECISRLADEEGTEISVEWNSMLFDSIVPAVKAKTVDLGVSGFSITATRLKEIQYTTPHSTTEGQILALNSTAADLPGGTIEDLATLDDYDLTIGVETGTTQEQELRGLIDEGKLTSDNLASYEDYIDAMDEMVAGTIDGVYAESPITYNWMNQAYSDYDISIIFRRPYYPVAFVANRDSDILCSKISGMISILISEGRVAELWEQYGMV